MRAFPRRWRARAQGGARRADRHDVASDLPTADAGRHGIDRLLAMTKHPSAHFSDEDWRRVDALLASGCWPDPAPQEDTPASLADVASALASLRASVQGETLVSAGPVTDQMLAVWSLARRLDQAATRAAEAFLTALTTRQMVSVDELDHVCAEIEDALDRAPGSVQPR